MTLNPQVCSDFKDIKILISGHAHPDHVEGDALVKQLTGAQVVVGRKEAPAVEKVRPGVRNIRWIGLSTKATQSCWDELF